MYADRWSPGLRQGDVFGEVSFPLAVAELRQTGSSGAWIEGAAVAPQTVEMPVKSALAVVVSHDCEFNEGKRAHFLAARVRRVDQRMAAEDLAEMRRGNDYASRAAAGEPAALDSFLLDPVEGAFDEPRLIDFCTITPFPMKLIEQVRALKRAELLHDHRVMLREKIALFIGRTADDIPDDEKSDAPAVGGVD